MRESCRRCLARDEARRGLCKVKKGESAPESEEEGAKSVRRGKLSPLYQKKKKRPSSRSKTSSAPKGSWREKDITSHEKGKGAASCAEKKSPRSKTSRRNRRSMVVGKGREDKELSRGLPTKTSPYLALVSLRKDVLVNP